MDKPMILVTGATGKTGSAVVSQLLEHGWPVRAVVRALDSRSEALTKAGAEVVTADLFDPQQLMSVMQGTSRAYYCPPFHPFMFQSAAAFAAAAQETRLEAIVGLSQWLASPQHPSLLTRQHWLADRLFSSLLGTTYTIVNPGYFADNYLRLIDFAAHSGMLPNLTAGSRNAPPSNEDIARVVVAVLTDPSRHTGRAYRPTGPTLLSVLDMAQILSRVLGRTVRPLDMPLRMFLSAARAQGIGAFELSNLRYYITEHKRGTFEAGAPTADVYDVTGRQPEAFETIAQRYATLPKAQRDPANTLRAWGGFLRIGVTPAYNLDRYERQQGYPIPQHPQLAVDSETWGREHRMRPEANTPKVATVRVSGAT